MAKKLLTAKAEEMVYRPLSELTKLADNPRTITKDDMNRLVASIRELGFLTGRPLQLSDRTGELVILGGNQRYEAARILKLDKVPTVLYHNPTVEEEEQLIIRDNVANGQWDFDILGNVWPEDKLEEWGVNILGKNDADEEWVGMPEYKSDNMGPYRQITVSFNNEESVGMFAELVGQTITNKTKSLWFPMAEQESATDEQYI